MAAALSTVEPDFVPSIPPQPNPLRLKNTIVAGSLEGGSCDAFVTSEGGNLAGHHTCFISVPGSDLQLGGVRDRQGANPALDALADNGGATLTHAPRYGSFAIDGGVGPCPETDARLVARPQNGRCDTGAFEWAGEPPPGDDRPPETEFLRGPVQDGLETMAFFFTGSDNLTPTDELIYECRLIEQDLTEAPEPQSPFEPLDPELIFQSCASGWQTELLEAGLYTFEVRAIDRAGREDPTPAKYTFNGLDTDPPDTLIAEKPPLTTSSRAATFTFSGVDGSGTPAPFLEYECRLDSRDPDLWLECLNPTFFSNLTTGAHTLEVRAIDGNDLTDPTPCALHVDGHAALGLRPGQHHADRERRRLGRRGRGRRELPVRHRVAGALGAGRERARPTCASRSASTPPTACWSRPRCACTRATSARAERSRRARWPRPSARAR